MTYAADRHIVIVPEIDMPGHATAANRAYPRFSGGGSERRPEFTFNPGNEATYTYLEEILNEVMDLFPGEWIHFGASKFFGKSTIFGHHFRDVNLLELLSWPLNHLGRVFAGIGSI